METNNEIKDFNIAEALRYAPKGLKLYTPLFGEIEFGGIENGMIRITGESLSECFYADGRYYSNFPGSECLLFPSVNHRCWQHWQNTLFLESIGSVCVDTITGYKYILENNGTFFSDGPGSGYSVIIENDESNFFLNSRYASPEETKEFFEELEKNGYKWDGKMVVKKEDKQKFYVGDNVYKWDGKDLKKEQNKPKFHEGDWVVLNNDICQIVKREEGCNKLVTVFGIEKELVNERNLSTARLWTIDDAKDGDVLVNGSNIFIFHFINGARLIGYCHVNTDDGIFYDDIGKNECFCLIDGVVNPATKEQRDLLFQKMKEVSYEWDGDTKKLIKTTFLIPKFKIGDIIKHKDTGIINSIKRVCSNYYVLDSNCPMYFEYQDMWELIASKVKPTLEEKVNILADEIIALKQRVLALEIQVIKDMSTPPLTKDPFLHPDKVTCDDAQCCKGKSASDAFETPDKAGDNVTLEDMKS